MTGKRLANSGGLLLLGAVTGLAVAGSMPAHAQAPPSRETTVGDISVVATLMGDEPAGVAVSDSGRVFVTFPRHDGPLAFTVGELKAGHMVPYPTAALNRAAVQSPADTLFSVQTVAIDASGHLWMLDTGTLQFGQPPVKGAAKLVVVDLASDQVVRTIPLPPDALVPASALKDFRIDFRRGQGGMVYITDSAPGHEALVVLDLASGTALRRLTGMPVLGAASGRTPVVAFQPLLEWPDKAAEQGAPKPWLVGLNAIELSADGGTLFLSAFTGRRLYKIDTADLSDPAVEDAKVASELAEVGAIGMGGHFALDANGRLYFLDIERNAIYRRTQAGGVQAILVDPLLIWPDTMTIGADEYLYVTTSQHDRRPEFHDGEELRQRPYGIYRVFVGAQPVKPAAR